VIAAQEESQGMVQDFQRPFLHLPKVAEPVEIKLYITIISHPKAQRPPLLGASGHMRG
jgi:hypothetical protein